MKLFLKDKMSYYCQFKEVFKLCGHDYYSYYKENQIKTIEKFREKRQRLLLAKMKR